MISLRVVLQNAPINILCADETKLDPSFPYHQFKIEGYQFPLFNRYRNSKAVKGGLVYLLEGFIVKRIPNLETEKAENICLEITFGKKKWCCLFVLQIPKFRVF